MKQLWKQEFEKPTKVFTNFVLEEHLRLVRLLAKT